MSDRPWLEDLDPALRGERTLLKRLNAQEPPAGSVDQGWAALSTQISGAIPLDPTPALAPTAKAAGLGLTAKIMAGVALTGGLAWTGGQLLQPDVPSAGPTQHVMPSAVVPVERRAEDVTVDPDTASEETEPSRAQRQAVLPRPAASSTTLAEEGRLLAKAHQLVQSGQGQQALEVLRSSEARYPRSVLYQEREVLTIEALGATGASAAAKQRAQRFLKRYPGSPHAGRLQRFVE